MNETHRKTRGASVREELDRIAPGLNDLKREDGYDIPHNYFKALPDRVIEKLAEQEKRSSAPHSWWHWLWTPRFALAMAAVALLITAGVWLSKPVPLNDPLVTISEAEALQYVMAHLDEFSAEDLIAASGSWDAENWIDISDDNVDEMIREILLEADEIDIEDLF